MSSGFAVFVLFIIALALLAFCGWLLYKQGVFSGFKEAGIFSRNGGSDTVTIPRSNSSGKTYIEFPRPNTARIYAV